MEPGLRNKSEGCLSGCKSSEVQIPNYRHLVQGNAITDAMILPLKIGQQLLFKKQIPTRYALAEGLYDVAVSPPDMDSDAAPPDLWSAQLGPIEASKIVMGLWDYIKVHRRMRSFPVNLCRLVASLWAHRVAAVTQAAAPPQTSSVLPVCSHHSRTRHNPGTQHHSRARNDGSRCLKPPLMPKCP